MPSQYKIVWTTQPNTGPLNKKGRIACQIRINTCNTVVWMLVRHLTKRQVKRDGSRGRGSDAPLTFSIPL
jgi:hypothetical protein